MDPALEKEKAELAIQEKEVQTKEFFLSFPSKKRYFIFTLLVLLIPIYFIAKYSVAAVYLHNFQKRAIIAHPAVFSSLPVQIIAAKALSISGDSYSAYAQIKNPNKDLIASQLDYSFHFLDANGNEISPSPVSGSTYILSGEQKYILVPTIHLAQAPSSVKVDITDPQWKRRIIIPNIIIKSGIPKFGDQTSPQGFYIDNTFTNESVYTLGQVKINAIVKDKGGNVIAVTQSVANTVSPNETREYKMFWPLPIAAEVQGSPQIILETNPFDPNNLK